MKNTVWIDNVEELTVICEDVTCLIQQLEEPFIILTREKRRINSSLVIKEIVNKEKLLLTISTPLPLGEDFTLCWGEEKFPIYPGAIIRTQWFDDHYADPHATLGAFATKDRTSFALWAPTATSVKLLLNSNIFSLNRQKSGVWKITIYGDWHGYAYEYEITVNGKRFRVSDPYAKSLLANSEKGVVIDFTRTTVTNGMRPQIKNLQDAIIYELHVRDATIHPESGVTHKGKYIGLIEDGTTTSTGASTALRYLKDLGITHVQLLPINDFARVNELEPSSSYNWGYDPLYFQVPEGSYSTDPTNPITRIIECKTMIEGFHQAAISVIIDVVYNHVYKIEESPLEKIVPGYYFRYHEDGSLSNGTGVGNDLASERKMVQKFILDTIEVWLTEYRVDGFRFDLMGILDVETIRKIKERCDQEDVPIMLLGEGWDLPTALAENQKATSNQSHQLTGIRFFNDYFRDSVKGKLFHQEDVGYVNGNGQFIERLPHLVSGSVLEEYGHPFVTDVTQVVNYVECHDNHTLWDRLVITNRANCESTRKKMHEIATGLTLLSQGIPFIHAGQEWFRTKFGDENSYISGDAINQLNWSDRELEDETITFVKSLIQIRKEHPIFRMTSKQEMRRRLHIVETPHPLFGYTLLGEEADFAIFVNPTEQRHEIRLPSPGTWAIVATNHWSQRQILTFKGEFTSIEAYELIVLKKYRTVL